MHIDRTIACSLLLVLAACERNEPATNATEEEPVVAAPQAAASGIPAALQGRWGLVPADCEPGRSDAKGLLEVDSESLEFYESVGQLGAVSGRTAHSISANFAFTGEGMEWTREMELAIGDGGETMVRREVGEGAMDGPLAYARCE